MRAESCKNHVEKESNYWNNVGVCCVCFVFSFNTLRDFKQKKATLASSCQFSFLSFILHHLQMTRKITVLLHKGIDGSGILSYKGFSVPPKNIMQKKCRGEQHRSPNEILLLASLTEILADCAQGDWRSFCPTTRC